MNGLSEINEVQGSQGSGGDGAESSAATRASNLLLSNQQFVKQFTHFGKESGDATGKKTSLPPQH